MKRIVSYSWFRNPNSIYEKDSWSRTKKGLQFVQFIPLLVRAHHAVWGGYRLRFHHDDRVRELPYFRALEEIARAGLCELVYFGPSESLCGRGGMLERLRPAWEPDAEIVVCRDVDSIPMPRDRAAVEEFAESGKAIHVIHSAPAHSGIMGGTLAVRAKEFRALVRCDSWETFMDLYGAGISMQDHGDDQRLLNRLASFAGHELFLHELDHPVSDMRCGILRTKVGFRPDRYIESVDVLAEGDSFSKIIGGCEEPLPAFDFYDSLASDHSWSKIWPELRNVRTCESRVGIDAREMMQGIAAL